MNERLFENSIDNDTNSKYSCTISSVIHIKITAPSPQI